MSAPEVVRALERLIAADEAGDEAGDEEIGRIFAAAFRIYARRLAGGGHVEPFGPADDVTATDVVTVASALLHAQNLEVFELALWQSWGGVPWEKTQATAGKAEAR